MTLVISHGAQLDTLRNRVGCMGMPHPVRRRLTEFLRRRRMVVFNNLRSVPEKLAYDFPQALGLDARIAVAQAADQRRGRVRIK